MEVDCAKLCSESIGKSLKYYGEYMVTFTCVKGLSGGSKEEI